MVMHEDDRKPTILDPSSPPLRSISPRIQVARAKPAPKSSRYPARTEGDEKQCTNCGEIDTPQWRGTLCNACALWRRSRGTDRPLPLLFRGRKRGRSDSTGSVGDEEKENDIIREKCDACGAVKDEVEGELRCEQCRAQARWRCERQRMIVLPADGPGRSYDESYSRSRPFNEQYRSPSPRHQVSRAHSISPRLRTQNVPLGAQFPPRIAALLERTQNKRRANDPDDNEEIADGLASRDELDVPRRWSSEAVEPRTGIWISPSPVPRRMPVQETLGFGLTRHEWMESVEWLWEVVERAGMALEGYSGAQ